MAVQNQDLDKKIALLRSLFKCREDVFALRWEKGNKSGYMPAYYFDPYHYQTHRIKGGTFQNYAEKSYLPLTDGQIKKHIAGEQFIGVYPLLRDNTSWFIVADFDDEHWIDDARKFLQACREKGIAAYLERSRSGNGGHVWIFFTQAYPAVKSRKIILAVLIQAGVISLFDKNSSFDRLFPNQDSLSGKGLGNLIALPLHKQLLEKGNSSFIDPVSLDSFDDQWRFISSIDKVDGTLLDEIYESLFKSEAFTKSTPEINKRGKLTISLSNVIKINRDSIPQTLINFLREELNFTNTAFIIKKNSGKNTFSTERYFRFITEEDGDVVLPKGFAGKLLRFCRNCSIQYELRDQRKKLSPTPYAFRTELRSHQTTAVATAAKKDMGVIVAPPGSGKTVIGLKIIAEKQQPALIIVHRKQLLEQWIERVEAFLGIPKHEIGKVGSGKTKIGKQITIATVQSIEKELEKKEGVTLKEAFGTIFFDECHHVPAQTYRNVVQQLNSFYLYGLTATPFRKYNDGKLIFIHLGDIISDASVKQAGVIQSPQIIVRETALDVPFNSKTDKFETLSKILIHDSARNKLILQDVIHELNSSKKVVILTERKEHIDSLNQYLNTSYEVITLTGDDAESSRKLKWKLLKEGSYEVLITTGQFFGEGTDLQNTSHLFLVYPFSFEGKLIQYIGRVQRSELAPVIYDYRDVKIDYLNKLFLRRNAYYRKLAKQASLFEDPIEKPVVEKEEKNGKNTAGSFVVDKEISVSIESLEFRFGGVVFSTDVDGKKEVEFEIQHDDFRPEFEVLKPYFIKTLKSKYVLVSLYAEFESGKLIAQTAESEDIKKINRQIIESMRFQFVTKPLFFKSQQGDAEEDASELQLLQENHPLYESANELLIDLLKRDHFKHHLELRFLAEKHAGNVLKVRFILQPFSFIFLLKGENQFHIVLETLDTEEATYLWHFRNNVIDLPVFLKEIEEHLNVIRKQGRQVFLSSPPMNFSRIHHDYSDDQKRFFVWKDLLEERLV